MPTDPLHILRQYWQFDTFRPQQEQIIQSVISGHDTLAILPTGGGKSICYQLPTLASTGNCLVVSPLIALMQDQANQLTQKGILCMVIHSGLSGEELRNCYEKLLEGQHRFVFVSPERLKASLFLEYLPDWNIRLMAVDEAHCISQWGYDFRPAYLDIAQVRDQLPDVTVIALTASATPPVQQDIISQLKLKDHRFFFSTFARDNLSYVVLEVENKITKAIDIVRKMNQCGLIYCKSRKQTKMISDALNMAGIKADYYHAGLSPEIRSAKQNDWIQEKFPVMVSTNAFGMGIDKANVRFVIHFEIPESPEAYYQEAGRAGRDGKKAFAILLYQPHDLQLLEDGVALRYPDNDRIRAIYESIAYYLSIPLYGGLDTAYSFEVVNFCKKFHYHPIEVISTIKLLEQQGFWYISDSIYRPSKVAVTATKSEINQLENMQSDLFEILQYLFRMYAGIWHHAVNVNEFEIAQLAGVGKDYIQYILRKLDHIGMISYIEANDDAMITYLHERVPTAQLIPNMELTLLLKERYMARIQFMRTWVTDKTTCRSKALIRYFGESIQTDCGMCDVCLNTIQAGQQEKFFEEVKNTIFSQFELSGSVNINLFRNRYSSLKQDQVMEIIRYLLDDRQIALNSGGDLIKK
jgi:ATP-dependent DNA helicase RecQ